jgi:hypothetical protein
MDMASTNQTETLVMSPQGPVPSVAGRLLEEIDAFMSRHEMSETQFGLSFLNNHRFVPRLRLFVDGKEGGRDVRSATIDEIRRAMAKYERGGATE